MYHDFLDSALAQLAMSGIQQRKLEIMICITRNSSQQQDIMMTDQNHWHDIMIMIRNIMISYHDM